MMNEQAVLHRLAQQINWRNAALFGFLVGLRSMLPVAAVTTAINTNYGKLDGILPKILNTDLVVWGTRLLALGELGADKLPFTPARTDPFPIFGRMGVAATFITLLARKNNSGQHRLVYAGIAALAAFAGSHVGYQMRKRLTDKLDIPDAFVAVAEDAVVAAGSAIVAQNMTE